MPYHFFLVCNTNEFLNDYQKISNEIVIKIQKVVDFDIWLCNEEMNKNEEANKAKDAKNGEYLYVTCDQIMVVTIFE